MAGQRASGGADLWNQNEFSRRASVSRTGLNTGGGQKELNEATKRAPAAFAQAWELNPGIRPILPGSGHAVVND
jgi:hypothetical protein